MKSKIIDNEENKYLLFYKPNLSKPKKDLDFSLLGSPLNMDPLILKKQNSSYNYNDSNYVFSGSIYDTVDYDKSSGPNKIKRHEIEKEQAKREIDKIKTKKFEEKEKIMKIVKTLNFIEGFWEINEMNKFIIEKYKKEYEKLKLKYSEDKVIITVLMIYYLNKESFELINELVMIIKKAKDFIQKETNCCYEDIVEKL